MELIMLLASYPLGDDTPIGLFILVGVVALALLIASVVLGKASRKAEDRKKSGRRNRQ